MTKIGAVWDVNCFGIGFKLVKIKANIAKFKSPLVNVVFSAEYMDYFLPVCFNRMLNYAPPLYRIQIRLGCQLLLYWYFNWSR